MNLLVGVAKDSNGIVAACDCEKMRLQLAKTKELSTTYFRLAQRRLVDEVIMNDAAVFANGGDLVAIFGELEHPYAVEMELLDYFTHMGSLFGVHIPYSQNAIAATKCDAGMVWGNHNGPNISAIALMHDDEFRSRLVTSINLVAESSRVNAIVVEERQSH